MVIRSRLYPDEDDFTSEHDRIFLYLLEYWRDSVHELLSESDAKKWHIWEGEIVGEPRLEGYPPVFPDAIVNGFLYGMHTKGLERFWYTMPESMSVPVDADFDIRCEVCNFNQRIRVTYPRFEFPGVGEWAFSKRLIGDVDLWWRMQKLESDLIEKQYEESKAIAFEEWGRSRVKKMQTEFGSYVKSSGDTLQKHKGHQFKLVYEIKPQIDSVGKVLRQLQEYRARTQPPMRNYQSGDEIVEVPNFLRWVILVTNDTRFDQTFESQGFRVFHPPESESAKGSEKNE